MEILTPSAARVEPRCPVARQCGGCQLQAMSYEEQLKFKERKVKDVYKRQAHVPAFVADLPPAAPGF